MLQVFFVSGFDTVHGYFEPGILLIKDGRPGQIDESIPAGQKETRLVAGVKKHPVFLNAAAQLNARHRYQGQMTGAITARD